MRVAGRDMAVSPMRTNVLAAGETVGQAKPRELASRERVECVRGARWSGGCSNCLVGVGREGRDVRPRSFMYGGVGGAGQVRGVAAWERVDDQQPVGGDRRWKGNGGGAEAAAQQASARRSSASRGQGQHRRERGPSGLPSTAIAENGRPRAECVTTWWPDRGMK